LARGPAPGHLLLVERDVGPDAGEPLLGLGNNVTQLRVGLAEQNPAPLRAPPGHLLPVGVEPFLAAVLPEVHEQRVGLARPTGADVDRLKKWTFEKRHLGTGLGSPGDLDLAAAMVPRDWLELPVLDPPFDVAVQAHSSRTPCV